MWIFYKGQANDELTVVERAGQDFGRVNIEDPLNPLDDNYVFEEGTDGRQGH